MRLYRNKFNKFNNTGAETYAIKITLKFLCENIEDFVIMYTTLLWTSVHNIPKYVNH